jgi:glycosyltransferase involved in cell wall biosynthesis
MATISVVIPTYNRADELRVCVASVLRLDRRDRLEVIVVDDGSSDGTPSTVRAFGDDVRYLVQDNAGPCVARNRGAGAASGDFLAFLDSDDELLPGWAGHMLDALRPRGTALACSGVTIQWDHGGRSDHLPVPAGPAFGDHPICFIPGAYAVSRELFHQVGGFAEDIRYGEHHELGLRLTARLPARDQVRPVPHSLVLKHHDRSPEVTFGYHRQRLEAVERMVDRHAERLGRDRSMLADYEGVAAFSAASLGEYRRARHHYRRAIRAAPGRWKPYAGLTSAAVPGIRRSVWSPRTRRSHEGSGDDPNLEVG